MFCVISEMIGLVQFPVRTAAACDAVGCDAVGCDAVACDWVVTVVCVFCFGACGLSRPLLRGGGLSGLSSLSAIKSLK